MKKSLIAYPDFQKLDLRVGEILSAIPVEKSRNLLELTVELGEDYGKLNILSGIAKQYSAETLVGKKLLFVANLEPKSMMGKISQGMILVTEDNGIPVVIEVDKNFPNGTIVR